MDSGAEAKIEHGCATLVMFLGSQIGPRKGFLSPRCRVDRDPFSGEAGHKKIEICLPAKKNAEILLALEEIMDNSRGMIRHVDVRKVAGNESGIGSHEAGVASIGMVEKVSPAASAGSGKASLLGGPLAGRVGSGGGRQHNWRRCSLLDWCTTSGATRATRCFCHNRMDSRR